MTLLTQEQYDKLAAEIDHIKEVIMPQLDKQADEAWRNKDVDSLKKVIAEHHRHIQRVKWISVVLKKDLEYAGVTQ